MRSLTRSPHRFRGMRRRSRASYSKLRWRDIFSERAIRFFSSSLAKGRRGRDLALGQDEPLRAELLSLQQLTPFAKELAQQHQVAAGRGADKLLPQLAENQRALHRSYDIITAALTQGRQLEPAAEWLLDNFFLIEQQINDAHLHLPRAYSRSLPWLTAGPMAGFPRVYQMAIELIAHLDGRLDAKTVTQFVSAYQEITPLRLSELWAFPIALRLGLVDNLRRVAVRIARRRRERDAGIAWAERMITTAAEQPKRLIRLLAEFADTETKLTAPFLEEFSSRLRGQGIALAFVLNWVEQALADKGTSEPQQLQADSHAQAAEQVSIANSIASMRFLGALDWKEFVETLSVVERTLRGDPANAYSEQDFATRDRYRHIVERLAVRSGQDEETVARKVVALAQAYADHDDARKSRESHIGHYLIGGGTQQLTLALKCRGRICECALRLCTRYALALYLVPIFLITAAATAATTPWFISLGVASPHFWLFVITAAIGASALGVSLVNFLATLLVPPRPIPRLDFSQGIPSDHRSIVVIPCLLNNAKTVERLLEALEIRYLGNRDPNIGFALLSDFADAEDEVALADAGLISLARAGIAALNERYQTAEQRALFYLLHRPRVWNPIENQWMGWERKRGKLEQFNAFLRGEAQDAFSIIDGFRPFLRAVKYVITLDADTELPRGAAHRLVGAMAHPLNQPRIDPKTRRVVEGYGILQPRASIRLADGQSRFATLFSGATGLDPYTREVSDVYQDLFGEGSYVGKGIYDVDAFREVLEGRFPDNQILSHDLLESGYARSALLSGVEVYENFPSTYLAEISRQHRWTRGDWQILRWLFPRPPTSTAQRDSNPLTALSRWKIFDNIRRSLVAPALLVWLLVGWGLEPAWSWLFTGYVLAILFSSGILRTLTSIARKPETCGWHLHLRTVGSTLGLCFAGPLLALACLPYEACITLDACCRATGRFGLTRRGLLLWNLPQDKRRDQRRSLAGFLAEMWPISCLALVGVAVCVLLTPEGNTLARLPLLAAWFCAPLIAWWLSRPSRDAAPDLAPAQKQWLRALARRTWHFFETFVTEENQWLPPDNYQETPAPETAMRTSPTNMGLALAANLSAWDFGYLSTGRLLERTKHMLNAMGRLERYHGHFYNWYDTQNLQPLRPLYISSVDSGNLMGNLVALRGGLNDLRQQPAVCPRQQIKAGLRDTLDVLRQESGRRPPQLLLQALDAATTAVEELPLADEVDFSMPFAATLQAAVQLCNAAEPLGGEVLTWAEIFVAQCEDHATDINQFALNTGTPPPTLEMLAQAPDAGDALGQHQAIARLHAITNLEILCSEMETEMDFLFLYDAAQNLLSIGYDVSARHLDPGRYDLLASEARLASYLLVASEQAPVDHWFALGRLLTQHKRATALLSWSGSMFEYLMPALLMPHYRNTLLDRTCRATIARQIHYGRQRNVPWGISESCYNARDARHVYQYRAFGVPGMGLKRGLANDLVIAPYATLLALPFAPQEAYDNLRRLANQEHALGAYGMYEAIDYTRSRVPHDKTREVIRTFMTHHQGMGLIAMANLLFNGRMIERFMADPAMRATELLLQERMPQALSLLQPHAREAESAAKPQTEQPEAVMRVFSDPDTLVPEVHFLSNGNYHVMVTHTGGGTSRWRDLEITRWREDATCDNWGSFIYLRDVGSAAVWSAAFQPTRNPGQNYEAIFTQGRAEYRRRDHDFETHTEICVSPEDDVEIRRVTLNNLARRPRRVELTSFAEVVMAPQNADLAHPAFSKLFLQTEVLPERQAILCTRRKRSPEDVTPWLFHLLIAIEADQAPTFETDRARFIGRGRTAANPIAMEAPESEPAPLSNSAGSVLDPIIAVRQLIVIPVDRVITAHLVTGVAETREAALQLIAKYQDCHFVERAFEMAWSHSQIVMRQLAVSEAQSQLYGRLASSIIYANDHLRAPASVIAQNRLSQQRLWHFGISGDLPILLLRIRDLKHLDRIHEILRAHAYWRTKGITCDIVIINEDYSGYRATLNDRIIDAINSGPAAGLLDKPGGVFVRRIETLSEEELTLLATVARVVLYDTAETLYEQVSRMVSTRRLPERFHPTQSDLKPVVPTPLRTPERIFVNGPGGFTLDGREYVIRLAPGETTPAPWCNVIASPHIGTVVSESGSMYTWVENAHEFRLTPWHNDPVSDTSGEAFYLRDEATGRFWSPTILPAPGVSGTICRHGFGYTVFEYEEAGIAAEIWVYVAMDTPVKFVVIKLRNQSGQQRNLSLTAFYELVLGEWRHSNAMHIVTEVDPRSGALFASNPYSREFANRVVFANCSVTERSYTGSRNEFIGRNGSLANPAALHRERLSNVTGAGLDPALGLQAFVTLDVGQSQEVVFTLGAAASTAEAQSCLARYSGPNGARDALNAVWEHWNHTLSRVHVETPDQATNVLLNGWLPYQVLSCRYWGRSGYYQSGGAYGFRDQLQDTMALIHAAPHVTREHLLRAASRQFIEGDVQHWWHPPQGAGVRTHFSDDYLWLPQVTIRYVQATGDTGVLDESIPFLSGRPVNLDEEAYYETPIHANESGTLYEHCVRALRNGLRFGAHGLPLIGCGDWNDGMNLIGRDGKGESVWLGWFLYDSLTRFSELATGHGDKDFAAFCLEQAQALLLRIEDTGWDGAWYRRAYFDDGTPLGSASNEECRIDSLSQSWAVISGAAKPERARQGMAEVSAQLVDRDTGIIRLFTPPFDSSDIEPGYIKGYPPGMRENGGQYTHGAIWSVMALALLGEHSEAWALFRMLNPILHSDTPEKAAHYCVEPYVMAADVYGVEPHRGRGGCSWYTGAAGWMYRLGLETLLGLEWHNDHLLINPRLPEQGWKLYRIRYHYRETTYHITIRKSAKPLQHSQVRVDGIKQRDARIPLRNDGGEHQIEVLVRG